MSDEYKPWLKSQGFLLIIKRNAIKAMHQASLYRRGLPRLSPPPVSLIKCITILEETRQAASVQGTHLAKT
jgi:hypothetical protein